MSIKVVFFDMLGTLVHYEPEAEDLLVAAAEARGISITPRDAHRGFMVAGEWWMRQMGGLPLAERPAAERDALYSAFDARVLKAAGVLVEAATAREIVDTLMQTKHRPTLAVYPEAAQALTSLQAQGKQLGTHLKHRKGTSCYYGGARPEGLFYLDSRPCGRAGQQARPAYLPMGCGVRRCGL